MKEVLLPHCSHDGDDDDDDDYDGDGDDGDDYDDDEKEDKIIMMNDDPDQPDHNNEKQVRDCPPAPGHSAVLVPGQWELKEAEKRRTQVGFTYMMKVLLVSGMAFPWFPYFTCFSVV